MGSLHSQYTYDNNLVLKTPAAVTVTQNELILDVGSGFLDDADMVVDVSAIDAAGKFSVQLCGSTDPTFATNVVSLAMAPLGVATAPVTGNTGLGRFAIPFRNEQAGVLYRYLRITTTCGGTVTTGITFGAFLGIEP